MEHCHAGDKTMKKSLLAATILTVMINLSAFAEEAYQAPRLKMKGAPGYKAAVIDSSASDWESSYQVEEKAGAERSVASDEDAKKVERSPGSTPAVAAPPSTWLYERR